MLYTYLRPIVEAEMHEQQRGRAIDRQSVILYTAERYMCRAQQATTTVSAQCLLLAHKLFSPFPNGMRMKSNMSKGDRRVGKKEKKKCSTSTEKRDISRILTREQQTRRKRRFLCVQEANGSLAVEVRAIFVGCETERLYRLFHTAVSNFESKHVSIL